MMYYHLFSRNAGGIGSTVSTSRQRINHTTERTNPSYPSLDINCHCDINGQWERTHSINLPSERINDTNTMGERTNPSYRSSDNCDCDINCCWEEYRINPTNLTHSTRRGCSNGRAVIPKWDELPVAINHWDRIRTLLNV